MNFSKYDIVSFDVFDTLVCRAVTSPLLVFYIAGAVANRHGLVSMEHVEYAILRRNCEIIARIRLKPGRKDITLDEIYEVMQKKLHISDTAAFKLKNIEIETENAVLYANDEGRRIYDDAVKQQKKIIITTDMYLPRDVIAGMLSKCGYSGYYKIYVSGECGLSKAEGELFEHIITNEHTQPEKIIHIGDNYHSDYMMPRRYNIDSMHLKDSRTHAIRSKLSECTEAGRISDNEIMDIKDIIDNSADDMMRLTKRPLCLQMLLKVKRKIFR